MASRVVTGARLARSALLTGGLALALSSCGLTGHSNPLLGHWTLEKVRMTNPAMNRLGQSMVGEHFDFRKHEIIVTKGARRATIQVSHYAVKDHGRKVWTYKVMPAGQPSVGEFNRISDGGQRLTVKDPGMTLILKRAG
ncbi:hypothetical protein [Thiomonas sp.]